MTSKPTYKRKPLRPLRERRARARRNQELAKRKKLGKKQPRHHPLWLLGSVTDEIFEQINWQNVDPKKINDRFWRGIVGEIGAMSLDWFMSHNSDWRAMASRVAAKAIAKAIAKKDHEPVQDASARRGISRRKVGQNPR